MYIFNIYIMIKTFEAFDNHASEEFYLSDTKFINKINKYVTKHEPKNKTELFDLEIAISKLKIAIKYKIKERVKYYMEVVKSILSNLEY